MKPHRTVVYKFIFSILLTLGLLELALRLTGLFDYQTDYGKTFPSRFWVRHPDTETMIGKEEFQYKYRFNSLGLPEKEIPDKEDEPDKMRILVLGDSYAESVGAAMDSAFPRMLERELLHRFGSRFRVINAGVSGSDPFFEYVFLKEKLLPLRPDAVIALINDTDIADHIQRGGMERFKPDGTVIFNKLPSSDAMFRHCYLCRLLAHFFLGYDRLLLSKRELEQKSIEAVMEIHKQLLRFQQLADSTKFRFVPVVHPMPNSYMLGLLEEEYIRLLPAMLDSSGMLNINLEPEFSEALIRQNIYQYAWKEDQHYNSSGYRLMAEKFMDELLSKDADFFSAEKN